MRSVGRLSALVFAGLGLLAATAPPNLAHAAQPVFTYAVAAPPSAPSAPPSLKVLSAADAVAYRAAFAAARRGDVDGAERASAAITDQCLMGRLASLEMSAGGRTPRIMELRAWLLGLRALPDADRAALSAKSGPFAVTPASSLDRRALARTARVAAGFDIGRGGAPRDPAGQAARDAFYQGDVARAHDLAVGSGERWIAGLSAYRLGRFAEAADRFAALAADATQNAWTRSGGAFWAARSATAAGQPGRAPALLQQAARTPYTFYGLIAERQLGMDPAVGGHGVSYAAMMGRALAPSAATISADPAEMAALLADPRAHRAAAYAQVGMGVEAGAELRTAALAGPVTGRGAWTALASALGVSAAAPRDFNPGEKFRFDLSEFPTPALAPRGGFTLDRALVYALVRQESRFNPSASSGSAYGLMQLTAATAARVAGDPSLARNPGLLHDAAMNLRLGQDYMARLLTGAKGDLLRAVASYNCGPGVLSKMAARGGDLADSLLMVESMPSGQTRDYVQRVMAGYWIYRQIFGQESHTLDAVASGAGRIAAALDR